MSCIAHYEILNLAGFNKAIEFASKVKRKQTGWWIFKVNTVIGMDETEEAWESATVETGETFNYSGYSFGYLDIFYESEMGYKMQTPEDCVASKFLENLFLGAYIFKGKCNMPEIDRDKLAKLCKRDYPEDEEVYDAIIASCDYIKSAITKLGTNQILVIVLN